MAFSKEQAERYSRHFVLKEIGVAGQKRLSAASVLVIGAGALGASALLYLAYTYKEYFDRTKQNLYKTKKVTVPEPKLYVVYKMMIEK